MLALSNIMLIDKTTNSKQLPQIVSKEAYRSMKQDFIDRYMRSIKFSDKLYKQVKRVFDKCFIYATKDEIRNRNDESRIALLKLARKANKYEKGAIEVIVNLIPVSTNNNVNRVSELHLTSSYIHNVVSSMFGSVNVIPHCSNLLPCETTEAGSKERPDYICDKYKNREYNYLTIFDEIKTEVNTNDLNHDLYRLAFFTKNAIEKYNLGICLSFQTYYVLMDIATIKIPTQRADLRDILLNLDVIVQLLKLHDIFCVPMEGTILCSPSASYKLFEQKAKQDKQTKSD